MHLKHPLWWDGGGSKAEPHQCPSMGTPQPCVPQEFGTIEPPKRTPQIYPARHQGKRQQGEGQQRWVCTILDVQRKGTHMGLRDVLGLQPHGSH